LINETRLCGGFFVGAGLYLINKVVERYVVLHYFGLMINIHTQIFMLLAIVGGTTMAGGGGLCIELVITDDDVARVRVLGETAYLAAEGAGLQVLDISDPIQPIIIGALATTNGTMDLDVVGDLVFLADGHNGLKCVDVSNPASPMVVGELDFAKFIDGIVVRDGIAYITDGFIDAAYKSLM
jgi:hypothetical protein